MPRSPQPRSCQRCGVRTGCRSDACHRPPEGRTVRRREAVSVASRLLINLCIATASVSRSAFCKGLDHRLVIIIKFYPRRQCEPTSRLVDWAVGDVDWSHWDAENRGREDRNKNLDRRIARWPMSHWPTSIWPYIVLTLWLPLSGNPAKNYL